MGSLIGYTRWNLPADFFMVNQKLKSSLKMVTLPCNIEIIAGV